MEDMVVPTVQNPRSSPPVLDPAVTANPRRQSHASIAPFHRKPSPQVAPQLQPSLIEEPELPPTPVQLGIADPIVTTPPTGIHDTPSKRARRKLGKKIRSSPLKPRDSAPESEQSVDPKVQIQPPKREKRRKSARFSIPADPHAAKKKERDDLLRELRRLEADLAVAKQENSRLRLHHDLKRSPPSAPKNSDEILAVLLRSTAPEEPSIPEPKPMSIFKSIGSFLPFSSRRKARHAVVALDKVLPSHLPIAVDNPLPYLQAFSPLVYTSNITLLPSEEASSHTSSQDLEQTIIQRHVINASHPSGLFNARLAMNVDSTLLSLTSFDVLKLDPTAEMELGTFMREKARRDSKDIGVVCWAMGRWA